MICIDNSETGVEKKENKNALSPFAKHLQHIYKHVKHLKRKSKFTNRVDLGDLGCIISPRCVSSSI